MAGNPEQKELVGQHTICDAQELGFGASASDGMPQIVFVNNHRVLATASSLCRSGAVRAARREKLLIANDAQVHAHGLEDRRLSDRIAGRQMTSHRGLARLLQAGGDVNAARMSFRKQLHHVGLDAKWLMSEAPQNDGSSVLCFK